ncbi:hypothetical protein BDZ94DRAFT_1243163 [Collybia nuda]|uniref:Uncharacterized protein n=1 Tax=Collybia nuda TaxID=64659 RepID=A0A9P6CKA5_9AGAR|nr:hypothetical protein BDZ94DRAFT_1243163 [Collybia nuda]
MDASHHLGQSSSLAICDILLPWLESDPTNHIHFHHITKRVEVGDHQLVHILASLTCIKAGMAPLISADFAQCTAVVC